MFDRADRIAHVVQAVEKANEVIVRRRISFGGLDIEAHAIAEPGIPCRLARGLDRARMIVESREARIRKCLRHQPRRHAMSAAHVGDPGAALELRSEERRVGKECRSRWSPYH